MQRIHLLPPLLANQIAAGEVIERPASVVKELLENSLDAGATQLEITLLQGGRQLIRIQDNGAGIHPEDLPLALARHATSKIHHPADLAQISTLGFRGEALASIASIARVTVTSQHGDHNALAASTQGRDLAINLVPAAHPRGTTVEVADIFYNTPARRKFLKSDRTEWVHIEEMIKRMALARPDVGFTLSHEGKLVKRYVRVPQDPALRVEQVLGKTFTQGARSIHETISSLHLEGWIADPESARSSTDMQYCYVNGRMVRDKMLNHAIRLAFEDKIYPGRFPAYVLHLSCDHAAVDVNVHPTKHEVRFREARTVHDFVFTALQKVLNPIVRAPAAMSPVETLRRPLRQETQVYQQLMTPRETSVEAFPLGRVIAVLDKRVVILQEDKLLRAVNWPKTLQHYLQAQWKAFFQGSEKPRTPLLTPPQWIHEQSEIFVQKLTELGCLAQMIGPNHCTLREMPRFLQGLPTDVLTPALLQQPLDALQRALSQAWAAHQSLQFREIERLLESCYTFSPDLISSKDYVPDMLI
jgi:DNA mismatch repair protein MutL